MIAAESLFLNDLDRREGELRFRMSLRAGWLLGADHASRLGVYRRLRRAYDVRSDIVHGNRLNEKLLIGASGPSGIDAFVEEIENLLGQALRRTTENECKNRQGVDLVRLGRATRGTRLVLNTLKLGSPHGSTTCRRVSWPPTMASSCAAAVLRAERAEPDDRDMLVRGQPLEARISSGAFA